MLVLVLVIGVFILQREKQKKHFGLAYIYANVIEIIYLHEFKEYELILHSFDHWKLIYFSANFYVLKYIYSSIIHDSYKKLI